MRTSLLGLSWWIEGTNSSRAITVEIAGGRGTFPLSRQLDRSGSEPISGSEHEFRGIP